MDLLSAMASDPNSVPVKEQGSVVTKVPRMEICLARQKESPLVLQSVE
jgi:hypothetical protein